MDAPGGMDGTNIELIHKYIRRRDANLFGLLCFERFERIWENSATSEILTFVIHNYVDAIKFAFMLDDVPLKMSLVSLNCFVLRIPDRLKDVIFENTPLFPFMVEFISKFRCFKKESQTRYFWALKVLMFDNEKLRKEFNNKDFFFDLLNSECFEFIEFIITQHPDVFKIIMKQVNACNIFAKGIINEDLNASHNYQNLLILLIVNNMGYEIQCYLLENNLLNQIIEQAIAKKDYITFNFLDSIYNIANSAIELFSNNWANVLSIITKYSQMYYNLYMNTNEFTMLSESILNLICSLITNGHILPQIENLILKMNNDFFKFPVNSFLHNSYYYLLKCLDNRKNIDLFIKILNCSNLVEQIINYYENMDKIINVSYNGQLREIAKLINSKIKYINNSSLIKKWKLNVTKNINEIEIKIKKSYDLKEVNKYNSRYKFIIISIIIFLLKYYLKSK